MLAGQRLLQPEAMLLYRLTRGGQAALVAGDASGNLWPFGAEIASEGAGVEQAAAWLDTWQQVTGQPPRIVAGAGALASRWLGGLPVMQAYAPEELVAPEELAASLAVNLADEPVELEAPGRRSLAEADPLSEEGNLKDTNSLLVTDTPPAEEQALRDLSAVYQSGDERLVSALSALSANAQLSSTALMPSPQPLLGQADWDLTLALTANGLLRLWARWLRGFGELSAPYLLEQFIRRPGRLLITAGRVTVELEPRPLDIVLHLSGYLAPLQASWLGERTLHFEIRGAE